MIDKELEARLSAVEEGLSDVAESVEGFDARQKETIELVQAHFEGLADTIRDAEEKIRAATEEAVERLCGDEINWSEVVEALERIEETVTAIHTDLPEPPEQEAIDVDGDELYEKVKAFVGEEGRASTSLLQRKFRIGYGRAARFIDRLEDDRIIEASDGTNRARKVVG